MEEGYHLVIAHNVGDAFSYIILPAYELIKYEKCNRYKPQTLVRSVVRHHLPTELHPPVCKETCNGLEFYDHKGIILVGDSSLVLEEEIVLPLTDIPVDIPDVNADGILVSPLSETILTSVDPPQNPITIQEEEIVIPVPAIQTVPITPFDKPSHDGSKPIIS